MNAPRRGSSPGQRQGTPDNVSSLSDDRMLVDIYQTVTRLEAQALHLKERFERFEGKAELQLDSIEGKINKLEHWKTWVVASAGAIIVIMGLVGGGVGYLLNKGIDVYVAMNAGEKTRQAMASDAVPPPKESVTKR